MGKLKRKSPAQLDRDIAHALSHHAHATIKGPKQDTTASLVEFLVANGIEKGRAGAASGAMRVGDATVFVQERTDDSGNPEITFKHQSSRGTSRQRFASRERALAELRHQIDLHQRFGKR